MSRLTASRLLASTLTPFLYPCLDTTWTAHRIGVSLSNHKRCQTTAAAVAGSETEFPTINVNQYDHLNPQLLDYSSNLFTDACKLTLHAGAGGHGCISFVREKFIPNGPADGGDGGTGGNVYIQAVRGETSLHKLARRPILKAARGKNGEGGLRGGKRGEDVLIQVPVGTVVREISRHDPLDEEEAFGRRKRKGYGRDQRVDALAEDGEGQDQTRKWRRDKWLLYPGTLPKSFTSADFPPLPQPRRSNLTASQPPEPLRLDLDKPMATPMLLAAGAMGGLGNPHFVTKSVPRPKYATKGEDGLRIHVQLELKLLADVGLVGLPNAGKSTLLRALTRSRTRVGSWTFTTLSPSIGTVVLDPSLDQSRLASPTTTGGIKAESRTHFTIADIPGLIEDAHLDRGLGLGFLRHIERAAVLAFVVDLSAGDAVAALQALWKEVGEYEKLRERELNSQTEHAIPQEDGIVTFQPFESSISPGFEPEPTNDSSGLLLNTREGRQLPPLGLPSISNKPWFVVATKADLDHTQDNFIALQRYLAEVQRGKQSHPSGKKNAWRRRIHAVPVSAFRKEGVETIPEIVLGLLEE